MFEIQMEVVHAIRAMAWNGCKPSEMLRKIITYYPSEMLERSVFARYFKEAFCFLEGEHSPLHGWRPDGTGELKDADIDYLMTKRIRDNKNVWEKASQSSS